MKTSISDIIAMFKQLNEDCRKSGETVVEFSDTVYYSEQIQNIYGCSKDMADQIASYIANFDEYFEFETYYNLYEVIMPLIILYIVLVSQFARAFFATIKPW